MALRQAEAVAGQYPAQTNENGGRNRMLKSCGRVLSSGGPLKFIGFLLVSLSSPQGAPVPMYKDPGVSAEAAAPRRPSQRTALELLPGPQSNGPSWAHRAPAMNLNPVWPPSFLSVA